METNEVGVQSCTNDSPLASPPTLLRPLPLQDVREWTRTLNQSPGHAMFQYQTFHMTLLTLSFYALLHPDSIKNGLTALPHDWGAGSLPSSVLNVVTNGRPWRTLAGITQSWRRRGCGGGGGGGWGEVLVFIDARRRRISEDFTNAHLLNKHCLGLCFFFFFFFSFLLPKNGLEPM